MASPQTMSSIPLSTRLLQQPINLQQQSRLYQIPPEVRDLIFAYALSPYTPAAPPPPPKVSALYPSTSPTRPKKANPWNPSRAPYDKNTTYSRPDQRAKMHHPTALLQVCRRTYLETAHLPVHLAAHNFYSPAASGPSDVLDATAYFARMTADQRTLVRRVRVFGNVQWLLDGGLAALCAHDAMASVEQLNLVIRWCDWRGWQANEPLSLSAARPEAPFDEDEDVDMEDAAAAEPLQDPAQQEFEFATPPALADADADAEPAEAAPVHADVHEALTAALALLPRLKSLTLTVEAPSVKSDELAAQLAQITSWPLHLSGRAAREAEKTVVGAETRRFEWEAPLCAWSDFCAHCGGGSGDDKACEERKKRRMRKLGPRVQGAVVRWC